MTCLQYLHLASLRSAQRIFFRVVLLEDIKDLFVCVLLCECNDRLIYDIVLVQRRHGQQRSVLNVSAPHRW